MLLELKSILAKDVLAELKNIEFFLNETEILEKEKDKYPMFSEFEKKEPNFLQKIFNTKENKEYNQFEKDKSENRKKIDEIDTQILNRYKKNKEFINKKDDLKSKIELIKKAKNIKDLGIEFDKSISILKENNIPLVLSSEDTEMIENQSDYNSLSDCLLVHKTRYSPENNIVKCTTSSGAKVTRSFTIEDKEYEHEIEIKRETVHFSINGEVSGHLYGDWDDCKYVVMVPASEVPKEQIGLLATQDTALKGDVMLTDKCYILAPKNEMEEIKNKNDKLNIVGYDGEYKPEYLKTFISSLGYRVENVGSWSWNDKESQDKFNVLREKTGIEGTAHSYSKLNYEDNKKTSANSLSNIVLAVKNNGLIEKEEDIEKIALELMKNKHPTIGAILLEAYGFGTEYMGERDFNFEYLKEEMKNIGMNMDEKLDAIDKNYKNNGIASIRNDNKIVEPSEETDDKDFLEYYNNNFKPRKEQLKNIKTQNDLYTAYFINSALKEIYINKDIDKSKEGLKALVKDDKEIIENYVASLTEKTESNKPFEKEENLKEEI
ncbi:MAG: hypothetical protein PHR25_03285 [Clostridia bacterium]|nr:hypothetical protein [Clostridia bacterium]MDD4375784.1 hypothetical protein [Clostridia bacterium]